MLPVASFSLLVLSVEIGLFPFYLHDRESHLPCLGQSRDSRVFEPHDELQQNGKVFQIMKCLCEESYIANRN